MSSISACFGICSVSPALIPLSTLTTHVLPLWCIVHNLQYLKMLVLSDGRVEAGIMGAGDMQPRVGACSVCPIVLVPCPPKVSVASGMHEMLDKITLLLKLRVQISFLWSDVSVLCL